MSYADKPGWCDYDGRYHQERQYCSAPETDEAETERLKRLRDKMWDGVVEE